MGSLNIQIWFTSGFYQGLWLCENDSLILNALICGNRDLKIGYCLVICCENWEEINYAWYIWINLSIIANMKALDYLYVPNGTL